MVPAGFLLVAVTALWMRGAGAIHANTCHKLQSQDGLQLDKMLGQWYGLEVIEHYNDDVRTGRAELDLCPIFTLSLVATNESSPVFRLLWREGEATIEYTLSMPEPHHKGFWKSTGQQNGTLTSDPRYRQFNGTVHVMRAVFDHSVLTFCSHLENQVFSVLLARKPNMRAVHIDSVNNMLQRRGLPLKYIKATCHGQTSSGLVATVALAALAVGALLVRIL